jgi:regulator of replication initiation timing
VINSSSSQSDDDIILMQRAEMVAEIKKLRAENSGLTNQVTELKGTIETYKKLDISQEGRITDLKDSIKQRTDAGNLDVKVESLYKDRITDFRDENQRLRDENAKLRKSRDRRSLITGILGAVVGAFAF